MIRLMDVLFHLPGGAPLYTFSLFLAIGSSLGIYWIAREAPKNASHSRLNASLYMLLGGLVGGRMAFVIINWAYFRTHLLEIPQAWLGGVSWPGALGGGIIALALTAFLTKQSFGELADSLFPLVAITTISAWLGCWLSGCAYGREATSWWGIPAPDEWGISKPRWPVQPLGALLTLGILWGLETFQDHKWLGAPGRFASLGVGGICLVLWVLSYQRSDPAPLWNGYRLDTWAALGFFCLAGLGFLLSSLPNPQPGGQPPEDWETEP
jgi:phosphatidylglycerol:prolipoprotein diacylglycerol transferase